MLKRCLLAALLWLAVPVSAAVVNGPKALRLLHRYDLPGGGNLPTLLLDTAHRQLNIPPDVQIPIALRFFGSAVYLADEKKNSVDWKNVGDLDMVLYVDREEHRVALKREHPFRSDRWIESKQKSSLDGLEMAVGKRLTEIAHRLGGVKRPHLIMADSGFEAIGELGGSPTYGYHPYEPHFGTETGISKIVSIVEKLPVSSLGQAIERRDASVRNDIEERLASRTLDAKALKRLIQRARLLGDEEALAKYDRLLKVYPKDKFDDSDLEALKQAVDREILAALPGKVFPLLRLRDFLRRGRILHHAEALVKWSQLLKAFPANWFARPDLDVLERQVARTLMAWRAADFDAVGRLQRTAEKAALEGADLIVIPR